LKRRAGSYLWYSIEGRAGRDRAGAGLQTAGKISGASTGKRLIEKTLGPLREQRLVDDVLLVPLEKCFQVRGSGIDQAAAPLLCRPRDVRGHEAVFCI